MTMIVQVFLRWCKLLFSKSDRLSENDVFLSKKLIKTVQRCAHGHGAISDASWYSSKCMYYKKYYYKVFTIFVAIIMYYTYQV